MRTALIGLTVVGLLTLAGCSSGSTATEPSSAPPASAPVKTSAAPEATTAPSPTASEEAPPTAEEPVAEEPATEDSASDLPYGDLTCADLEDEAVRISEGEDTQLLKVRAVKLYKDNRETLKLPKGDKEALVFSCKGTGVWSDTSRSPVLIRLVIDADGDAFVGYQEL